MANQLPQKGRKKYFALLEDILVNPEQDKFHEAASLWEEENLFSTAVYLVRKFEGTDAGVLQKIPSSKLLQIKYNEALLLLAVPKPLRQRLTIVKDKHWLPEGSTISVETVVELCGIPGLPSGVLGTVRYKGRLPGKNGTFFGVELMPEQAGKGSCNGTYGCKTLFTCAKNCGLFTSLVNIRLHGAAKESNGSGTKTDRPVDSAGTHARDVQFQNTGHSVNTVLAIGERVVWYSDEGPEKGTVRWQGKLSHSQNSKVVVGVEFDNPVGTGTGTYNGQQLFRCNRKHASLLPMLGLMKLSDCEERGEIAEDSRESSQGSGTPGSGTPPLRKVLEDRQNKPPPQDHSQVGHGHLAVPRTTSNSKNTPGSQVCIKGHPHIPDGTKGKVYGIMKQSPEDLVYILLKTQRHLNLDRIPTKQYGDKTLVGIQEEFLRSIYRFNSSSVSTNDMGELPIPIKSEIDSESPPVLSESRLALGLQTTPNAQPVDDLIRLDKDQGDFTGVSNTLAADQHSQPVQLHARQDRSTQASGNLAMGSRSHVDQVDAGGLTQEQRTVGELPCSQPGKHANADLSVPFSQRQERKEIAANFPSKTRRRNVAEASDSGLGKSKPL